MERLGHAGVGNRVGDGRDGEAGQADDVTGLGFVDRYAIEAAERHDLRCAAGLDDLAVVIERVDRLVELDHARIDAAGEDTAQERIAIE
ncbi:hypothetical protein D9M73_126200 [compost metagenome]